MPVAKQGEFHGCPFKQWAPATIEKQLTEDGLRPGAITNIVNLVAKQQKFTAACRCELLSRLTVDTDAKKAVKESLAVMYPPRYFTVSEEVHRQQQQ